MTQKVARFCLGSVAFGIVLFAASPSHAQPFYEKGEISVALERGFGIHYVNATVDPPGPGPDGEFSATSIGLGWAGALHELHYTRGAVDGFIIDRLSLGGSIAFFSHSGDADDDGFLFAPRVGYAVPISNIFTFWPRGGITYFDHDPISAFAISGEAAFVLQPQPSWGVILGVTLDLAFTGSGPGDSDYSAFAIGFPAVGLMATF